MAAMVERPVDDLGRKLESIKIDAHRKPLGKLEVAFNNGICLKQDHPIHLSPTSESFQCNGSVSSTESCGDATNSFCSRDDYAELAFIAAPNAFVPPPGPIYACSPAPVMNVQSYVPYPMESVQYPTPVVDFSYVNQSMYGSMTAGVQYTGPGNNGYVYGPQVYQLPPQTYYQQGPVGGQYIAATTSGLPAGGMVLLETQDPGLVMSNGYATFNGYGGPMPGYPLTIVQPPNVAETEPIPVAVTYPTHTLRASAPAWIEPSKPKATQKDSVPVAPQSVPQLNSAVNFPPLNKSGNLNPAHLNGSAPKNPPISGIKAVMKVASSPSTNTNPNAMDAKATAGTGESNKAAGNNSAMPSPITCGQNKDGWASKVKGQQFTPVKTVKTPSGCLDKETGASLSRGEVYNSPDFITKYEDAKFYIIKSYSDENVFKSIQYGVWASTPNGNKKLDEAYQDAQRRAVGKAHGCPVFLFFSVNGSRQFCGVAEMTSSVDYNRTMEFWEQHKWSGSFQVKWHIVKDVPNSQFRRIILQNNENKPVTNSRDTQEVSLQQGLEMLNIFKSYPARGSILDEFPSYPSQKVVQEVKPHWSPQCFPKIGEQVLRGQVDEPGLKVTTKLNSSVVKGIENGFKVKEVNSQGKHSGKTLDTAGQDSSVDKDKIKLDKENIKYNVKESVIVAT